MFFTKQTIYEGFAGLHFEAGKLVGVLPTGRHVYFGSNHRIVTVDLRPQNAVVGGQEVTTVDGGSFKVTLVISHRIEDPALHYRSGQASGGADLRLHQLAQVAIREWVASRTFKDAFAQRAEMVAEIRPGLVDSAKSFGVQVILVSLLDFTVTGGLRNAYADLLKSQIEGEAALARARNEVATMRSLLNTARLVREHPGLLELRVLSSGQKPRVTFVVGGAERSTGAGTEVEPAD